MAPLQAAPGEGAQAMDVALAQFNNVEWQHAGQRVLAVDGVGSKAARLQLSGDSLAL